MSVRLPGGVVVYAIPRFAEWTGNNMASWQFFFNTIMPKPADVPNRDTWRPYKKLVKADFWLPEYVIEEWAPTPKTYGFVSLGDDPEFVGYVIQMDKLLAF